VANLMPSVMGAFAEFERSLIRGFARRHGLSCVCCSQETNCFLPANTSGVRIVESGGDVNRVPKMSSHESLGSGDKNAVSTPCIETDSRCMVACWHIHAPFGRATNN
jgi:hypothetical protein